jgi:hypothetical protein
MEICRFREFRSPLKGFFDDPFTCRHACLHGFAGIAVAADSR